MIGSHCAFSLQKPQHTLSRQIIVCPVRIEPPRVPDLVQVSAYEPLQGIADNYNVQPLVRGKHVVEVVNCQPFEVQGLWVMRMDLWLVNYASEIGPRLLGF